MSVQKENKKRQTVLLIILGVVLLFTIGVMYYVFFTDPEVVNQLDEPLRPSGAATIRTGFDLEVLAEPKAQALREHGEREVQVQLRGRKDNPFEAF